MKCSTKTILTIAFGIFCSVFASVLSSSYSYAINDISVTITSSDVLTTNYVLFPNCDISCFFSYNYLKVDVVNPSIGSTNAIWLGSLDANYKLSVDDSSNWRSNYRVSYQSSAFYSLDVSGYFSTNLQSRHVTELKIGNPSSSWSIPSGMSVTYTLTENAPSSDCPVCEECQVCPSIPANPYDDKFDGVIKAIYVCSGTLLVLYFFYCIYRIIIKNSGVK